MKYLAGGQGGDVKCCCFCFQASCVSCLSFIFAWAHIKSTKIKQLIKLFAFFDIKSTNKIKRTVMKGHRLKICTANIWFDLYFWHCSATAVVRSYVREYVMYDVISDVWSKVLWSWRNSKFFCTLEWYGLPVCSTQFWLHV